MNRFFIFLKKIYLFLIFILIEVAAISYYANSSVYSNSKIMNASNYVFGGIYSFTNDTRNFIELREHNSALLEEVATLSEELSDLKQRVELLSEDDSLFLDSIILHGNYNYITAEVVNNTTSKQHNFITLNKGSKDGIKKDMSIVSEGAVVGYVVGVSGNFSVAMSLLNIDFRSSGKELNGGYFGALCWDGVSSDIVLVRDIPNYAKIEIGDTIVSTNFSTRFPEGLTIGVVESFELTEQMSYTAKVKLGVNFNTLHNLLVIENSLGYEQDSLESEFVAPF